MDTFGIILIVGTAIAAILFYVLEVKKKKAEEMEEPEEPVAEKSTDELLQDAQRMLAMTALLDQAKRRGDQQTVEQILSNTYDGVLPEQEADGTWEDMYASRMTFSVAGINFRKGIKKYVGKDEVRLLPDPKNEFDENAIKVVNSDNALVGYVPRREIDTVLDFVGTLPAYGYIKITEEFDDNLQPYLVGIVTLYNKNKAIK